MKKAKIEILVDGLGCDEGDIISLKAPIENGAIYYYDFGKKWFKVNLNEENIAWRMVSSGSR